jgi:hypothetical protein
VNPFEAPHETELLRKPIKDLGLRIEGSPLEKYVVQLHRELERKGLKHFKPRCYLTDEWGCPDQEPVIGIPFYLADPKLAALEKHVNDLEDEREIMMYLRHEAGHAFNYAYARCSSATTGRRCSARSGAPTATATTRSRSRAASCGTSRAGTRRSTRTRTSRRPSRCG